LLAAVAQIEGLTLEAAGYMWPADPDAYRPARRNGVDEVAFGVELRTREGPSFRAEWRMFDVHQGLLFRPVGRPPDWPIPIVVEDTSHDPLWHDRLGRKVEQVRIAWHVAEAGAHEAVWSVALVLSGERIVVLALGSTNEKPLITYMPDAVVVIFERAVAEAYRSAGSRVSAFGEALALQ
jgi:hypothetical protein